MCCRCTQSERKTATIQARVPVPWLDLKELSVNLKRLWSSKDYKRRRKNPNDYILTIFTNKAFKYDHGSLFKHSKEGSNECMLSELQVIGEVPSNSLAEVSGQESIPVKVDTFF